MLEQYVRSVHVSPTVKLGICGSADFRGDAQSLRVAVLALQRKRWLPILASYGASIVRIPGAARSMW